jgi:hypothetical protein
MRFFLISALGGNRDDKKVRFQVARSRRAGTTVSENRRSMAGRVTSPPRGWLCHSRTFLAEMTVQTREWRCNQAGSNAR